MYFVCADACDACAHITDLRKNLSNKAINQSINQSTFIFCELRSSGLRIYGIRRTF